MLSLYEFVSACHKLRVYTHPGHKDNNTTRLTGFKRAGLLKKHVNFKGRNAEVDANVSLADAEVDGPLKNNKF